jgi:hypothetical protein
MKTPKEILLNRHEAMEPKLDAARKEALATLGPPAATTSWREFLFSLRWHLAGLSVIWVAVLALNIDSGSGSPLANARDKIPSAHVLVAALVENRRELMEELTGSPPPAPPAAVPPRRSEIRRVFEFV